MNICGFKAVSCPCSTPRQETSSAEQDTFSSMRLINPLTHPTDWFLYFGSLHEAWGTRVILFLLFYLGIGNVKNGFSVLLYPESQGLGTPCHQRRCGVYVQVVFLRCCHI